MKILKTVFVALIALVIIAGCAQEKVVEDIVASHPDNTEVIFENDYVKAVVFTLKPGEALPMHKGGPRTIYALSDYVIKWTEGEDVSDKEWTKGDLHWHDAVAHAIENTGSTDARYLVVTRTAMALPDASDSDLSHDASQLDSEHSKILFENDHVRVIEVTLDKGESQPKHDGLNRLIYSLSDYQLEYSYYKMNAVETDKEAGFVHWHTADKHSVKNVGDTMAQYLVFSFKK